MAKSEKAVSKAAAAASKVMSDPKSSKDAKTAAASALTQSKSKEQTGAKVARAASRVLNDPKGSKAAKTAAASTLTQKNMNWRRLANEAQRAPVRVHVEGALDVVVISEAEYQRFRRHIGERLMETMDRIGAEARRRGLTEEKLDELLADES